MTPHELYLVHLANLANKQEQWHQTAIQVVALANCFGGKGPKVTVERVLGWPTVPPPPQMSDYGSVEEYQAAIAVFRGK